MKASPFSHVFPFAFAMLAFPSILLLINAAEPSSAPGKWSNKFSGIPGLNGRVVGLAASGPNIYAAGDFDAAGHTLVHSIARWDGTNWYSMGDPLKEFHVPLVLGVATDDAGKVYFGGGEVIEGLKYFEGILSWENDHWQRIDEALPEWTHELLTDGHSLYAAGFYSMTPTTYLMQWNGSEWIDMGITNAYTQSLVRVNDILYAAGSAYESTSVLRTGFARRVNDKWESLGSRADFAEIRMLAQKDGTIYGLGDFRGSLDFPKIEIARWDGQEWVVIVESENVNGATSFVVDQEKFILAGRSQLFEVTYGATRVLDKGTFDSTGYAALLLHDSQLYLGGQFREKGDKATLNIGRWDGQQWNALSNGKSFGVYGSVQHMAQNQKALYVAGSLQSAGDLLVDGIARWDGTNWSSLGLQTADIVTALAVSSDKIFAALISKGSNYLSSWDGSKWINLGTLDYPAYDLAIQGDNLYLVGQFEHINGKPIKYIAKWDGRDFLEIAGGLPIGFWIKVRPVGNTILVGGSGILRLEQSGWSNVGVLGTISEPGAFQSGLAWDISLTPTGFIVAGSFSSVDGTPTVNIAEWNGSWIALAHGNWDHLNSVYTLQVSGDEIYAAGILPQIDGVPVQNVARRKNNRWAPLGAGVNGAIFCSGKIGHEIFFGGQFSVAGGNSSPGIASWLIDPEQPKLNLSITYDHKIRLSFETQEEATYVLEATSSLAVQDWHIVASSGSISKTVTWEIDLGPNQNRFFRINASWVE